MKLWILTLYTSVQSFALYCTWILLFGTTDSNFLANAKEKHKNMTHKYEKGEQKQ